MTNNETDRVNDAIARSISHNEIVTIPHSTEAVAALQAAASPGDWTELRNARQALAEIEAHGSVITHQFWGVSDGDEWRVHLVRRA